eukprot:TRINITY_DN2956_c0_g1_i3.p1 TRINITY_DN2956_c0_g1~~TRINITY_DN2956_c0_g1_i3.p1  ORF type:complete len:108 (+),score=14.04 TRINITY_DN2956_c0_g1_i3:49-372(+)
MSKQRRSETGREQTMSWQCASFFLLRRSTPCSRRRSAQHAELGIAQGLVIVQGNKSTHADWKHLNARPENASNCGPHSITCLLYTSDAADEEDSVDLGGRRIIKKKK